MSARRWTSAALLGVVAAACPAAGEPPAPVPAPAAAPAGEVAVPPAVRRLVERVQAASARGGASAAALFDREALVRRVLDGLPETARAAPALALRLALPLALREPDLLPPAGRTRLLRWEPPQGESPGVLVLRVRSDEVWMLHRLWLVERPQGWSLVDLEAVDLGLSLASFLSLSFAAHATGLPPAVVAAYGALAEASAHAREERWADVRRSLSGALPGARLHPPAEGVRSLLLALAAFEESPETAAQHAEAALGHWPDLALAWLIRARALGGVQPERSVAAAEAYLARVGDDPEGCELLADGLLALERPAAAEAAARRGLATDPEQPGLVWTLLRALPDPRRGEALGALVALPALGTREVLEQLVALDRPEGEPPALLTVVERALGQAAPSSPWRPLIAAAAAAQADPREALRSAAAGLRDGAPAEVRGELRGLLARLPSAEGPDGLAADVLEAVPAGDRPWIFSALAHGRATEHDRVGLEALLARARALGGVGPDLAYYDAEVAWLAGDLTTMLDCLARLPDPAWPLPPGQREEAHPVLETVLGFWPVELRVRGLVRLGRAAEALPLGRRRHVTHGDARLLLVALSALGRVEAVERAFDAAVAEGSDPASLADDIDLGPRLREEGYAALRERHGLAPHGR